MKKQIRLLCFVFHVIVIQCLFISYKIYTDIKKQAILRSYTDWYNCVAIGKINCGKPVFLDFNYVLVIIITFSSVGAIGALIMGFSYRTLRWYKKNFQIVVKLILGDYAPNVFAMTQINSSNSTGSVPVPSDRISNTTN